MTAKIINKDNDNLLIEWEDEVEFGHLGVNTVLEIIKAVEL
jgi:hypothetical protein